MIEIGTIIKVNAYKGFEAFEMKCVDVKEGKFGKEYSFDNGISLFELELQNNFDLWKKRNGYVIIGV